MGRHDRTVVLGMLISSFFSLMYARKKNVRKKEGERQTNRKERKKTEWVRGATAALYQKHKEN